MKHKLIKLLTILSPSILGAQTAFIAPGMDAAHVGSGSEVHLNLNLGKYWKYEVTSYEYHLFAGTPTDPNGSIDANGRLVGLHGFWNNSVASVGGKRVFDSGTLYYEDIYDNYFDGGSPSQEILLKDEEVRLQFSFRGNISGVKNVIRLHGVAIKEPPVPTGEIGAAGLVRAGATPRIDWMIRREGTTGLIPNAPETFSQNIDNLIDVPGESPASGGGSELELEFSQPTSNAPNSGKNKTVKTNNGHGNNIDGIDSSNPGRSAGKWYDKWGLVDSNGGIDDEGKGGGAAPSRR